MFAVIRALTRAVISPLKLASTAAVISATGLTNTAAGGVNLAAASFSKVTSSGVSSLVQAGVSTALTETAGAAIAAGRGGSKIALGQNPQGMICARNVAATLIPIGSGGGGGGLSGASFSTNSSQIAARFANSQPQAARIPVAAPPASR